MKANKSLFASEDAALRAMLQRNDPVDVILPHDCVRLEMFIMDRVADKPQLPSLVEKRDYFSIPRFMGGALSWPVTLTTTMALGLVLGFFISSKLEAPAPAYKYTITTAMAEPWPELTQ